MGVADGGIGVTVGGSGVAVGGTGVAVEGTGVAVDGMDVTVGGTGVGAAAGPPHATSNVTKTRAMIHVYDFLVFTVLLPSLVAFEQSTMARCQTVRCRGDGAPPSRRNGECGIEQLGEAILGV
jgi:hypothetical protein